jgi:tRNA-modifying protein YgfZ
MTVNWLEFLESRGARVTPPAGVDFGDPEAELRAARSGDVIAPLSHLATLGFSGPDAADFLQGQLSCDVQRLDSSHGALGCYCTPQGRMLANFLLWRDGDELRMALAADIARSVQKRLQMFVLRAKVKIADLGAELVLLGVVGAAGRRALRDVLSGAPAAPFDLRSTASASALRLPGERFLVAVRSAHAPELWKRFAETLTPVGPAAWQWLDIAGGMPLVTGPTQDQFVPQMVNLELIGGVDFRKGCYTGQEVIARTQYRGKVKRRMYRAHVAGAPVSAGDQIVGGEGASAGGTVVNAAASPEGGYDVLAVLQSAAVGASDLRLRAADGPKLELRSLPYSIE